MFKKIKFAYITVFIVLLYDPILSFAKVEIRKITPPKLDSAHLGKEILCHRPMRLGAPKMEIELRDRKVIAHNYGHGGGGWTLGPGSASYVNNLLINSKNSEKLKSDTPIAIIGAGALGLFTAYDLEKRGFKNITIIAENFVSLTSHNAGGLLVPWSLDNNPVMQKVIDQIGIDGYGFYADIARHTHKDFKDGAKIVPTYFQSREESRLESYVGKAMRPAKDVILDFGNGTTRNMVSYDDGIFIDASKMMTLLIDYLKSKKIKFVQKKVKSFTELDEEFIINCTGLGAAILNNDNEMVSVQGHLIMLKDQNPQDLQYIILIYFPEDKTKTGQKIKRAFYILPKHLSDTEINDVGVIGGTYIEHATYATPNQEEFVMMIRHAREFYGIK